MSIFEQLFGSKTNKERGLQLLRERGATKAVLSFSGGNDEGGVEEIKLFFPPAEEGGEPVTANLRVYYNEEGTSLVFSEETKKWEETPAEKPNDVELSNLLCAPVDDEFGTWAGEFEAYGTLTWDVEAGTIVMDKNMTYSDYEQSERKW